MFTNLVYMIILFALVGLLPIANALQRSVTLYRRDAIELGFAASMMMNDVYPNIIMNSPDMPSDMLEMIKSTMLQSIERIQKYN